MSKRIQVVCGVVIKNDKILIARRKNEKSNGGLWEFPGGKLEIGEGEADCLERELMEELSMQVHVESRLGSVIFLDATCEIELIAHSCTWLSQGERLVDHDKLEWVNPSDLSGIDFSPADIELLKTIEINQ